MSAFGVRWLKSGYDQRWHAFPAERADDPAAEFLQARCEHSVPVQQIERIPPPDMAALCPACLGKLADPTEKSDPNERWAGTL